jgi:hypothetical protein
MLDDLIEKKNATAKVTEKLVLLSINWQAVNN